MTDSHSGQPPPITDELAWALRRVTRHTLAALQSLRVALQEHVHSERERGATLAEIDSGLSDMIEVAIDSDGHGHSPERIAELRAQVLTWSEAFYSRPR